MGRKPLPENQKKVRLVLYLMPSQAEYICEMVQEWGPKIATMEQPTVRLPVIPLDEEDEEDPLPIPESRLVYPPISYEASSDKAPMPAANVIALGVLPEQPYIPSMRECSVCGKDYDGNLHDSCPHEHVPNGKRK